MQPYSPNFLSDQAQRTQATRRFFYNQVRWSAAPLALDLGCGTGAITPELAASIPHAIAIGIDIDPALLSSAIQSTKAHPAVHYLLADATALPFRSNLFSFTLDHFTLMWIQRYQHALEEAYRVLHTSGMFASIEPDYAGRIEAPLIQSNTSPPIPPIIKFLLNVGAHPYLGSQLPQALDQAGYKGIRFGVLAWEYSKQAAQQEIRGEATLLKAHKLPWAPPHFTFTPLLWVLGNRS